MCYPQVSWTLSEILLHECPFEAMINLLRELEKDTTQQYKFNAFELHNLANHNFLEILFSLMSVSLMFQKSKDNYASLRTTHGLWYGIPIWGKLGGSNPEIISRLDRYAFGYDNNRNHKILRIFGHS